MTGLRYLFDDPPGEGTVQDVAAGVLWVRMPLPFKLDHINLWLLDDGKGWTIVDTGIRSRATQDLWQTIFSTALGGRPVTRVLSTHHHPDHVGLAGWLAERWGVPLWMTQTEWLYARMLTLETSPAIVDGIVGFYRRAGCDQDSLDLLASASTSYAPMVSPLPVAFRRIRAGDVVPIGGRAWRVMIGAGHAPEHACLYSAELKLLIGGDQLLPRITPNVSVWPEEPEADPLRLYLGSLSQFRSLPEETVVLPSHDLPYVGLHTRLGELTRLHDARLSKVYESCARPSTAMDVVRVLFERELDSHQLMFAVGESLSHLHFLMGEGRIARTSRGDGVDLFHRT